MATPLGNGPLLQDMPPKGGYPRPEYLRRMPKRIPGSVLWGACAFVMAIGFRAVHTGFRQRNHLTAEKRAMRAVLIPYLQAEADENYLKHQALCEQRESLLMSDVPGWQVGKSVYHNKDIWVPPPKNYA